MRLGFFFFFPFAFSTFDQQYEQGGCEMTPFLITFDLWLHYITETFTLPRPENLDSQHLPVVHQRIMQQLLIILQQLVDVNFEAKLRSIFQTNVRVLQFCLNKICVRKPRHCMFKVLKHYLPECGVRQSETRLSKHLKSNSSHIEKILYIWPRPRPNSDCFSRIYGIRQWQYNKLFSTSNCFSPFYSCDACLVWGFDFFIYYQFWTYPYESI
jgi:hypothetical protein